MKPQSNSKQCDCQLIRIWLRFPRQHLAIVDPHSTAQRSHSILVRTSDNVWGYQVNSNYTNFEQLLDREILCKYQHSTKLYWKISQVCCHLYCYKSTAQVTMPMATNEWYFFLYAQQSYFPVSGLTSHHIKMTRPPGVWLFFLEPKLKENGVQTARCIMGAWGLGTTLQMHTLKYRTLDGGKHWTHIV